MSASSQGSRGRLVAVAVLTLAAAWTTSGAAQNPYDDPPPPAPAPKAPPAPPAAPKAPPAAPKAPPAAPKAPPAAPKAPPAEPKAPPAAPKAPPAEPKAPVPAEPKAPEPAAPGASAAPGQLPSWHPPVQPGQPVPGRPSREDLRRRMEEMLKNKEKLQQIKEQAGAPEESHADKKHFPVDAHGNCIGDGPQDKPKDINLFHGWFGVNNEAAKAEPARTGGEEWWGRDYLGNKEWWLWRLTPYMYRYENHDDHCDPRNEPVPLLANVINIGVLLFLLIRFGRGPITGALRDRKRSIMKEIDDAQRIKKEAVERYEHYLHELEHLDDRLVALREQYAAEGVREQERAREDAEDARRRLLADAEFRVSQEGKSARDHLSREALEEALAAAEKLLSASITKADHDRLAEEYLEQIGPALTRETEEEEA